MGGGRGAGIAGAKWARGPWLAWSARAAMPRSRAEAHYHYIYIRYD